MGPYVNAEGVNSSRGILVPTEIRTPACGPKTVKDVENDVFPTADQL